MASRVSGVSCAASFWPGSKKHVLAGALLGFGVSVCSSAVLNSRQLRILQVAVDVFLTLAASYLLIWRSYCIAFQRKHRELVDGLRSELRQKEAQVKKASAIVEALCVLEEQWQECCLAVRKHRNEPALCRNIFEIRLSTIVQTRNRLNDLVQQEDSTVEDMQGDEGVSLDALRHLCREKDRRLSEIYLQSGLLMQRMLDSGAEYMKEIKLLRQEQIKETLGERK